MRSRIRRGNVPSDGETDEVISASGLPLRMNASSPVIPTATWSRRLNAVMKRALLDIPLALSALLMLAPIFLVVSAAIAISDRGPVLFRQRRVGLNGRQFMLLKFRTLRNDQCDESGHTQVIDGDARVTPLGAFLRATSLDELPQLINILAGEMAVIGPRPMVPGQRAAGTDYRELVPYYGFRESVKPGLSGWAQANGLRGSTDDALKARQRIEHDAAYVQNFSLALDIRVIWMTLSREFFTGSGV